MALPTWARVTEWRSMFFCLSVSFGPIDPKRKWRI